MGIPLTFEVDMKLLISGDPGILEWIELPVGSMKALVKVDFLDTLMW